MRRRRPKRPRQPLPPALPPGERTVGQLVAESARFYGAHFWRSLVIGVPPACTGIGLALIGGWWRLAFALGVGAPLLTASYVRATLLVHRPEPDSRRLVTAFGAGWIVLVPGVFLSGLILPAMAWLALLGLVVPVILVERRGVRASFARAVALARVDYIHAVGSLATLAITSFLTATVLFFLLHNASEAAREVAAFLALLVISPVLFIGAAFLYFDQAARAVRSAPRSRRSRDAQVPADVDADRQGRPDAEGQPRPATGGQS